MTLAPVRAGVILVIATLLQSCGGGSGGDEGGDGGGEPPAGNTRFTLSRTRIELARTAGELAPVEEVEITLQNVPTSGLYVAAGHSPNGIETIEFAPQSATRGTLSIHFKSPSETQNDTYEDEVAVYVCYDSQCDRPVQDSPQTVQTVYRITGDGLSTVSIDRDLVEVTADVRDGNLRDEAIDIVIDTYPPSGIYARETFSTNAVRSVSAGASIHGSGIGIQFLSPFAVGLGLHEDTIDVQLCYDHECTREVRGSPFTINTRYTVTIGVEQGVTPLPIERQEALGHDIVASAFSKALNAIVMVGTSPENALYVYDVASGTESHQVLAKAPMGLAVSPDGLTAAVGHELNISIVDLADVGVPGTDAPALLDFDASTDDLVIDSTGHVHAYGWDRLHTLDIASNTESHSDWISVLDLKLHAAESHLYVMQSVPLGMARWDVTGGFATRVRNWPYTEAERSGCYRLWLDESGSDIYTKCGEVFHASDDPDVDMTYAGTLALTEPVNWNDNSIHALSADEVRAEIAIVEASNIRCDPEDIDLCFSRVAFYDKATFERTGIYAIGPVTHAGTTYAYVGRHLFHDAANGKKYLLGEIQDPPSADLRYWLSVIP